MISCACLLNWDSDWYSSKWMLNSCERPRVTTRVSEGSLDLLDRLVSNYRSSFLETFSKEPKLPDHLKGDHWWSPCSKNWWETEDCVYRRSWPLSLSMTQISLTRLHLGKVLHSTFLKWLVLIGTYINLDNRLAMKSNRSFDVSYFEEVFQGMFFQFVAGTKLSKADRQSTCENLSELCITRARDLLPYCVPQSPR